MSADEIQISSRVLTEFLAGVIKGFGVDPILTSVGKYGYK